MRDNHPGSGDPEAGAEPRSATGHEALEALRQSEGRCRALITHANEVILIVDAEGVVTFCSAAVHHTLGYSEEEIVGKTRFDLIHPEDYHRITESFTALVRRPGRQRDTSLRVAAKGGGRRQPA
jgi:PAS domain S-box-containing protein